MCAQSNMVREATARRGKYIGSKQDPPSRLTFLTISEINTYTNSLLINKCEITWKDVQKATFVKPKVQAKPNLEVWTCSSEQNLQYISAHARQAHPKHRAHARSFCHTLTSTDTGACLWPQFVHETSEKHHRYKARSEIWVCTAAVMFSTALQ